MSSSITTAKVRQQISCCGLAVNPLSSISGLLVWNLGKMKRSISFIFANREAIPRTLCCFFFFFFRTFKRRTWLKLRWQRRDKGNFEQLRLDYCCITGYEMILFGTIVLLDNSMAALCTSLDLFSIIFYQRNKELLLVNAFVSIRKGH